MCGTGAITTLATYAPRIINNSINFASVLVELSNRDLNWFEVRHLEIVDDSVFLTEEHNFGSNNAKDIRDLTPSFVINEFHWKLVFFGLLVETVFHQVVTGVLVHGIFELLFPDVLQLTHHVLLQTHV